MLFLIGFLLTLSVCLLGWGIVYGIDMRVEKWRGK